MTFEQYGDGRLEVRDRPGALIHWIGLLLGAIAIAAVLFAQSLLSGIIVAVATLALWIALRLADVATEAEFDKADGRVRIRHVSLGRSQAEWEGGLEEIENVVVEASARARARNDRLELRPALVVGGQSLPLTFGRYARGDKATEIALALRRFLGLSPRHLIDDSIAVAARDTLRRRPAVRLARFGKRLPAAEAEAYVDRLRAETGETSGEAAGAGPPAATPPPS